MSDRGVREPSIAYEPNAWESRAFAAWLAGGETDFALGHGEPGRRVHHQQDVGALVPEAWQFGTHDEGQVPAGHRVLHVRGEIPVGEQLEPAVQGIVPELLPRRSCDT